MPGHCFFQLFSQTDTKIVLNDPDEFAHLARVLRLKTGDEVEVINGRGAMAKGIVEGVGKSSASIKVLEIFFASRSSAVKVTLACAIPKKAKFETIIEKCTELGVDRIIPLLTERGDVLLDGERSGKKAGRFGRVAINAAKQCKRRWFPEITAPAPFEQAIRQVSLSGVKIFIPWLEGKRDSLNDALLKAAGVSEVVFFIGPEGDFSPQEIAVAVAAGAVPVSLGENVLKVDTAAIAVISVSCLLLKSVPAR